MSKAYSVFVCLLLVHSLTYDFCNGLVSNSERSVKVHIAHVLNSRELVAGNGDVKPQIQFVGPFVYDVKISKSVVRQNVNETLTFTYKKSYIFNSDESVSNENDAYFSVPSVPYLRVISSGEEPKLIQEVLEASSDSQPFVLVSVKDLLWGYEDPILKTLKAKGLVNSTKYGIFLEDEEAKGEILTVSAGLISADALVGDEYDKVELIDGQSSLKFWKANSSCSEIHGSDFMDPSIRVVPNKTEKGYDSVSHLSSHACRSIDFVFEQEETDESGHEILRFEPTTNIFSTEAKDNKCFCRNDTNCPSQGTLDLFNCKPGITVSWPYFASADSSIVSQHDAMFIQHGNNEENYLEVVKATGRVRSLTLSMQYNSWMKPFDGTPITAKLPKVLLPLVQITDSIVTIEEEEDDDGDTNTLDTPEAAELKKEAKKVVKHVVNAKLNKKHKKHKGAAGSLNAQTVMTGMAILVSMTMAHFY